MVLPFFQDGNISGGNWRSSEGEGKSGAEAALVLREEKHRAVAQNEWLIALGKEIPHIEQRLQAFRAIAGDADGLAEMQIQERLGHLLRKRRHSGHGIIGLPCVAGAPLSPGTVQRARE